MKKIFLVLPGLLFFLLPLYLLLKFMMKSTEKRIFDGLLKQGIQKPLALLIVAQSKHETAVHGVPYMSSLFLTRNNAFGYGYVKGNSLQEGTGGNHPEDGGVYAKYSSLENSVRDVAGWYKRRARTFSNITEPGAFATALKLSLYYTAPTAQYQAGVTKFFKTSIS